MSLLVALVLTLAGCQGGIDGMFPKAEVPVPDRLVQRMKAKDMPAGSPIMLRIFKTENVIEVWKARRNGRFDLLETYEICKWSGKLGPKFKEGDRQAPEGFYTVNKAQMNPNSEYHLSFNLGFPNTFDRAHGRTGSHLMVHGACSSAGCYSMTDERVEEIYALARDAFKGGMQSFQVQAYPFRMTAENMARHVGNEHFEFWKMLKEGYDNFEITKVPPKVNVCERRYLFNRLAEDGKEFSASGECPPVTMPRTLLAAYSEYLAEEKANFRKALLRERAKVSLRGEDASAYDPDRISIVARGSEVLPPATPEPAVEAPVENETPVAGADAGTDTGTGSATAPDASSPAAKAPEAAAISGENVPGDGGGEPSAEKFKLPEVVPVPMPAPANLTSASVRIP